MKTRNQRYRLILEGGIDGSMTLRYPFSQDRSLTPRSGEGPVLSMTRDTIATYFNSAGTLVNAAANEPRFTHNPATGKSLGLLIEPEATNLCVQSNALGTTWTGGNAAVTVPPTGLNRLVDDASTGTGSVQVWQNITVSTDSSYRITVYAKADQLGWLNLEVSLMASQTIKAWFNITDGVVGSTSGAEVTYHTIEDVGNGVYRCAMGFTSDAVDTSCRLRVYLAPSDSSVTVDLDGTSSIYVGRVQFEAGDAPTSYIPTTTVAVQRNKEICTADVTGLINSAAGTLYADFSPSTSVGSADRIVAEVSDGDTSDRVDVYLNAQKTSGLVAAGSVEQADVVSTKADFAGGDLIKVAMGYALNDVTQYTNGVAAPTPDTSATMPTGLNTLYVGVISDQSQGWLSGTIAELRYYNERKENAWLQDMTS